MKRRNPFPGVTRAPDRHGKVRWRFRRRGFTCYLPGLYGSVAFRAAYEAALKGARPDGRTLAPVAAPGSFEALIRAYLSSPRFMSLAAITRRQLAADMDWLRTEIGDLPVRSFEPRHVEALMSKRAGPTAANRVKIRLSTLFNYAGSGGRQPGPRCEGSAAQERRVPDLDGGRRGALAERDRSEACSGARNQYWCRATGSRPARLAKRRRWADRVSAPQDQDARRPADPGAAGDRAPARPSRSLSLHHRAQRTALRLGAELRPCLPGMASCRGADGAQQPRRPQVRRYRCSRARRERDGDRRDHGAC